MAKKRTPRSAELKARVALEAVRERKTVGQLAGQFGVHPSQVHDWKRRLVDGAVELFRDEQARKQAERQQAQEADLFEQIGRMKVELEWLKKTAQLG